MSESILGSEFSVCAELEICHSRVVAPTRRVALGSLDLPDDYGPVLLGCIVGWFAKGQDGEFLENAARLLAYASHRRPMSQPHLRYRFQQDRVGLLRSTHQLRVDEGSWLSDGFDFGKKGKLGNGNKNHDLCFVSNVKNSAPAQHVLGALYSVYQLNEPARHKSYELIDLALGWAAEQPGVAIMSDATAHSNGSAKANGKQAMSDDKAQKAARAELLLLLVKSTGRSGIGNLNPDDQKRQQLRSPAHRWAMKVMEFDEAGIATLSHSAIQARFRTLLRQAHPDSGGNHQQAPERIADLSEARRILIS